MALECLWVAWIEFSPGRHFVIAYVGMTSSQLGLCMPTEQVSPVQASSIYLTVLPPSMTIAQQLLEFRGYPYRSIR